MDLLIMFFVLMISIEFLLYFDLKSKIKKIINFSNFIIKNFKEENEIEVIKNCKELLKNSLYLLICLMFIILIILFTNYIHKDFINYLFKLGPIIKGTIFILFYYYVRKKIIKL